MKLRKNVPLNFRLSHITFLLPFFSVDSVLYSREVDPAELLMDLGFGGQSTDLLARIPARFFQKSQVTISTTQDYIVFSIYLIV